MRIKGLINMLNRIKEKYGNVEVLTMQRIQYQPPKACWLIDGARFNLEESATEAKGRKCPIVL